MGFDVMSIVVWSTAVASFVLLVLLMFRGGKDRVALRMERAATELRTTRDNDAPLLRPGRLDARVLARTRQEERRNSAQQRMMQAGLYKPKAVALFITVKLLLATVPMVLGIGLSFWGLLELPHGMLFGGLAGLAGTVAPNLCLDHVKKVRQAKIRRALPDAMDVMVVCLEGGLSLTGAFSRVARELSSAHPMLTTELAIVERETRLGRGFGEALHQFADRFDLEELRSMASVINQSERLGSGVVTALTVFADTLRMKRQQRAEELAHKASVKIIFPTVLFIFPAVFVVILGPAIIRIYHSVIQSVPSGG